MSSRKQQEHKATGRTRRKRISRWEAQELERVGYYCHINGDYDATPTRFNAHTHGLGVSFGHADLQIVVPLAPVFVVGFFEAVLRQVRGGRHFQHGDRLPIDILDRHREVLFVDAVEDGRPVLRIIMPDREGNLASGDIQDGLGIQYADLTELN